MEKGASRRGTCLGESPRKRGRGSTPALAPEILQFSYEVFIVSGEFIATVGVDKPLIAPLQQSLPAPKHDVREQTCFLGKKCDTGTHMPHKICAIP